MFCTKCGEKIEEEEKFCGKCGTPRNKQAEITQSQSETVHPLAGEKSRRNIILPIVSIVAVLLILFVYYNVNRDAEGNGNEPGSNIEDSQRISDSQGNNTESGNAAVTAPTEETIAQTPPAVPEYRFVEVVPEYTISTTRDTMRGLMGEVTYTDGLLAARYSQNRKFGFLNGEGKVIIEPIYNGFTNDITMCPMFSEGKAFLYDADQGKTVLLTNTGVIISTYEGNIVENSRMNKGFKEDRAVIKIDNTTFVLDATGNIVYTREDTRYVAYNARGNYSSGRIVFHMVDREKEYASIIVYDANGNTVYERGDWVDMDYFEYSDNLLTVKHRDGLWGAVGLNGEIVLDFTYERLGLPGDGLIPFMRYGTWGYIDYNGNVVIEREFAKAYRFNDGVAPVRGSEVGVFWFINKNGERVTSVPFSEINGVSGDRMGGGMASWFQASYDPSETRFDNGSGYDFRHFNDYGFAVVTDVNRSNTYQRIIDVQGNTLLNLPNGYHYLGGRFFHEGTTIYRLEGGNLPS